MLNTDAEGGGMGGSDVFSPFCSVAILAGGLGTRLGDLCLDLPKPMVPILGKPVIQYQIELCRAYGFTNIALLVQHRHEQISDFFGDGSGLGVSLKYVIEPLPRGTAGALRDALPLLEDRFIVLYGDTFMDVDLRRVWNAHLRSGSDATLLLHPNDHPYDSDLVEIDSSGSVVAILPCPHPPGREVRNLVNAALYVLERDGLEDVIPVDRKADIAKDVFPRMLELRRKLHSYLTPEYIKDMGTPERLKKVEHDFVAGLPDRLSTRHLRSAVFLDRDGTLVREVDHLTSPDQLELLPGVASAVRQLNRNGVLAIVVTNQPVVARGEVTQAELAKIHARLESKLGVDGAFIDGLYFCPHHPDAGYSGEIFELKVACLCRKPEPGLIDAACSDLCVDRGKSWMIGDSSVDIEAGRRAGVRTILLRTGYAGTDNKIAVRPSYVLSDLSDAVDWILCGHAELSRRLIQVAASACEAKRVILIGGLARAGKSFSAQVLKELLHALGRESHVISLDGWLKPKEQRSEGAGVLTRYDLAAAGEAIAKIVSSNTRRTLRERLYDRISLTAGPLAFYHSIGPDDILIVEGVPALLMGEICALPDTLKVYVEVAETTRADRLYKDYVWRGKNWEHDRARLVSREIDEVPLVMQSRNLADFVIEGYLKNDRE